MFPCAFLRLKFAAGCTSRHSVQGWHSGRVGVVAGAGEVAIRAVPVGPSAAELAAEVVGGVVGAGFFCVPLQPSQTHSLNFSLLRMAVSGRGVMRHTEQGG